MPTVTVSSKFQVVIPKEIRKALGLRAGVELDVFISGSRIELIPLQPINTLKGTFHGIDTDIQREEGSP